MNNREALEYDVINFFEEYCDDMAFNEYIDNLKDALNHENDAMVEYCLDGIGLSRRYYKRVEEMLALLAEERLKEEGYMSYAKMPNEYKNLPISTGDADEYDEFMESEHVSTNKKSLYESIMKNIAKEVKKALKDF